MKTNLSIRSLKILAISAVVAGSLTLGVLAQPSPEKNDASVSTYINRLESFISNSEKSLMYKAPDAETEQKQAEEAIQRLDQYAAGLETSLLYKAPFVKEDETVQNLDLLTESTLNEIKYRAPETDLENSSLSNIECDNKPGKISDQPSMQETWLINAGYVKSSGKPVHF
jgi:outer membrane murein-binding lipoprotein Lpp